jgi:hypothetical protein
MVADRELKNASKMKNISFIFLEPSNESISFGEKNE